MSITQEQLNSINEAKAESVRLLNQESKQFDPSEANWEIVRKFLVSEGIRPEAMTSAFIWTQAILECRSRGLLTLPKTAAQIAHEKDVRDHADGSFKNRHRPKTETPAGNLDDVFTKAKENLQRLFNPQQEAPKPDSKTDWPTFEVDFEQMEPADRKKFLALSAADTKAWMKRRAVIKHRQQYGLDSTEQ